LKAASADHSFAILLLQALQTPSFPAELQLSASINFKNIVKFQWETIPQEFATQIKTNIVELMLSVTNDRAQKQLSAALALISEYDFPSNWPTLLPDLVKRLNSQDFNVLVKVLSTIDSVLKRYQHAMKTEATLLELQEILAHTQEPLLKIFSAAVGNIEPNKNNPTTLVPTLKCVLIMSKIFFSLNAVDLPEYFEDHMSEWMTLLHTLLTFESSLEAVVGDEDDEKAGLLHKVKSQVCRIINLYTSKYEEEFTPYFITFLHDIWSLLERTNLQPRYDSLAVSAMQFLSTLASGVQHTQFKESGTLRTICEKIVIPNLQLRDVELENFADNPVEYIRRDIEGGGDNDTRRNASTQLIKSLRKYFEVETTQICQAYITELLKTYTANPQKNWLSKDVSIYLVTALAVRSTLASQGATNVNELVPVMYA